MATRYVTKPAADAEFWDEANALDCLAREVYEADPAPRPTGVLDRSGNELYAINEREPVGFVRFR